MKEEEIEGYAGRLKALASPVRLRILLMLIGTKRPLHIKAVADNLGMDYAAVYRHVETLKNAHLIEVYEVGRSRVLIPLDPDFIKHLFELIGSATA